MNKYTLKFKDLILEQKFQQTHQIPTQTKHLKYTLISFLILELLKIFQSNFETQKFTVYILSIYIVITLLLICFQPSSGLTQNIVIIFLNSSFTIFVLYIDEKDGSINQYFKSGNHMIFCIIHILQTEFIEATFLILIQLGLRSSYFISNSTNIDFTALILGFTVNIAFIYIQYDHRKAQRSQYLLSQANYQWEKILKQLMYQQEFLVLSFDEDKNSFKNLIFSSTSHFKEQKNMLEFLRNSHLSKQSLENYFNSEIKKFQTNLEEVFNKQLFVKYQKKIIEINFSLFFGSRPTIVIVFQTLINSSQRIIKKYNQVNKLLKFIIKISKLIDDTKAHSTQNFLKIIVSMQISYHQLRILSSQLVISIIKIHTILNSLQQSTKCIIKTLFDSNLEIETIPNIFKMLILMIIDCSANHSLIILHKIQFDSNVLIIKGKFHLPNLEYYIQRNQLFLISIVDTSNLIVNQTELELRFQKEIVLPYLSIGDCSLRLDTQVRQYHKLESES